MEKVKIIRKDGIVYERKARTPSKLTRCLCIRIDDERFNKLSEYGDVGTIIRDMVDIYFDKYVIRYLDKENNKLKKENKYE